MGNGIVELACFYVKFGSILETGTFLALVMGWFSSSPGTWSLAEVEAEMLHKSETSSLSVDL